MVTRHTTGSGRSEGDVRSFTTAPAPDADGDGVADVADACSTVPRGTIDTDVNGCPDDSDKDSRIDELDACPAIAAGAFDTRPADGCPDDADRDGRLDQDDACDDTPAGPRDANADGCPDPFPILSVQRPTYRYRGAFTKKRLLRMTLTKLTIDAPAGAIVRLRCRGGCSIDKRFVSKGRTLSLLSAFGKRRRVPLASVIEIRVVRPDFVGQWFRMRVDKRAGGFKFEQQCMAPNTLTPKAGTCGG